MFVIRRATIRDIPYLHYLDVCCYDNPWDEGTCRLAPTCDGSSVLRLEPLVSNS